MARPITSNPLTRRSATVTASIPPRLRYQAELAAELEGKTLANFVEGAIASAIARVRLPRPTGIPLELQDGLWQTVKWQNGEKHFADARVRERLAEHIIGDGEPTSTTVADEIILWDESPATRFFLRCYLASATLSPLMAQVWREVKRCSAVEYTRVIDGRSYTSVDDTNQQRLESYVERNWAIIERVLCAESPLSMLPDEKSQVNETANKKRSK